MKTKLLRPLEGRRLLVAVSGSIAAIKTPLLISGLIKAGAIVRCIVTPSAARLVSTVSLATLSRNRCYQDEDQWSPKEPKPLHISLSEWAELVVVAPLSASSLSRWTQGLSEGLLASVLIACEKPVIAAAAMNTAMWSHPAVAKNWNQLKMHPKVMALEPSAGLLACDRIGDGRMVNTELIQLAIQSCLIQKQETDQIKKDWKGIKLLASAGPTVEALDPARLITNRSSGRMGVLIAQAARFRGATVDLIHGPLHLPEGWLEGITNYPVQTAEEMQDHLKKLQPSADAISMAAAVADLKKKQGAEKIKKELLIKELVKNLELVPDLLKELSTKRPKGQVLLGFAALTGDDIEIKNQGISKKLKKGCDLLFANPINRPGQGFEEDFNSGWLLGPNEMVKSIPLTSKLALAHELLDIILEIKKNFSKKS